MSDDFQGGCETYRSLELVELHFIQVFIQEHYIPLKCKIVLMGNEFPFDQLVTGCFMMPFLGIDLGVRHTLSVSHPFSLLVKSCRRMTLV